MAKQHGVSTSVGDLVTALLAFAAANAGWATTHTWTNTENGTLYNYKAIKRNGSSYVVIKYNDNYLALNTCVDATHLGSGSDTDQTGAAQVSAKMQPISGPHVGYDMFCVNNNIVNCVVQVITGVYTHLNFGDITKCGVWTGGTFVTGSWRWSAQGAGTLFDGQNDIPFWSPGNLGQVSVDFGARSHMRSDVSGTNRTVSFCRNAITGMDCGWCSGWMPNQGQAVMNIGTQAINNRPPILPMNFYQATNDINGPYYQLGTFDGVGVMNMDNLNPGDQVNTDWYVYPIGQQHGNGGTQINTRIYGIVYKG